MTTIKGMSMTSAGESEPESTPYDGCGRCFLGMRRLSRKSDTTDSPAKQAEKTIRAVAAVGGHIIAWADDMEVSGATDPRTRPGFGPWLRDERGPYDGIAGSAVDRIGRNLRDILNTAHTNHEQGRKLVTADHVGLWDLDSPSDEQELAIKALGAQMEHRAVRTRNQDDTVRARERGRKKSAPSYGYMFVRSFPNGPITGLGVHEHATAVAREMKDRILADETGMVTRATEAARLTRSGELSPKDHLRVLYGKEPLGSPWTPKTVEHILTSWASVGYLTHKGEPVLGADGHPVQIAPPMWDRATRAALVAKLAPRRRHGSTRAPRRDYRLSGLGWCGNCAQKLWRGGTAAHLTWGCTARVRGIVVSQHCKPAPSMYMELMDAEVETWFLARHGSAMELKRTFDPGTGYAARIAELEADRERLKSDRKAGIYDSDADTLWFRTEYARMGREIGELRALPERPAAMRLMPTGRTVADKWVASDEAGRRLMLAEFSVRVVLLPEGAAERLVITSANPFTTPLGGAA
ncbi:recombinase family protein [Streptomyces sp. NPDC051018]|uniref:recombinase family protein n=1 Tax=Streptomyces sp. NPDC051018 TaxID=3365639 RepID=UPI0037A691CE